MKKTALAAALTIFTGAASAANVSTGGSFIMYSQLGLDQSTALIGSQTPVNTDSTITGFVNEASGTWGVSSTTPFSGLNWTASNGKLISGAGDYVFNTTTGAVTSAAPDTTGTADGMIHFTIGTGQIAGSIDFAWGGTTGIRVIDVWKINADGSLTAAYVPGMENGPFPGFNAAFNLTAAGLVDPGTPIPVPAAVWLFGSGLVGLVSVARRKKAA